MAYNLIFCDHHMKQTYSVCGRTYCQSKTSQEDAAGCCAINPRGQSIRRQAPRETQNSIVRQGYQILDRDGRKGSIRIR